MAKITLTKVFRSNKDKEGKELIGKNGRPYEKLGLKAQEYGDRWISGFGNRTNQNWKEGDQVEVEIEEKGQYLNFKTIDKEEVQLNEMKTILTNIAVQMTTLGIKIDKIGRMLEGEKKSVSNEDDWNKLTGGDDYPVNDLGDQPF